MPLRHTVTGLSPRAARDALVSLALEVLDLYAPPRCVACEEPWPAYPAPSPALCALCANALEPAAAPPIPGALAPYEHGGPLAHAVRRAKYGDAPGTARALGGLLAHALEARFPGRLGEHSLLVPVPLHARRLAHRGYNQALELARGLMRAEAALHVRCLPRALVRARDTRTQVHQDGEARRSNLAGAFALGPEGAAAVRGARILLLDDVLTTGATLGDAARALYEAGALRVTPVALAQASLRHHP